MGRVSFKLPDIGEGIAEAEIVAWHVKPGDMIEEDAPIADLMTDKATVEMAAPVAGRVVEIAGAVGELIAIGSVLAVFETADETEAPASPLGDGPAADDAVPPAAAAVVPGPDGPTQVDAVCVPEGGTADPAPDPADSSTAAPAGIPAYGNHEPEPQDLPAGRTVRVLASPAVRARAKDLGVDLADVKIAAGDRVRHADLDAYLRYAAPAAAAPPAGTAAAVADRVEEVKVVGLRRRIAENMAEAKRRIPHFAYVEEIDVTALEAMRKAMNGDRGGLPKLTLLPFLIKALCRAVADYPMVNARYDDEAGIVRRHRAVHLGMAAQTPQGLMVPVIRDAGGRGLTDLAREIARLAEAAKTGKATRDELSGSTITLTSLGALGGIVSTPVINRPEVAIVGVNRLVERPVVKGGEIVVAKMMNLSSSFDHRVVDGHDAASFIQAMRRLLETPALLFAD